MKICFCERVRALRIENKKSQLELAKALETTQRKISYWENGKVEPSLEDLWKLSDYFSVSIDFLVGKNDY